MAIRQVDAHGMARIAPLFSHVQETLIWSCLQGQMGVAWADDRTEPVCAQILTGDFCFFAGDAQNAEAQALLRNLPRPGLILVPTDAAWEQALLKTYGERLQRLRRFAVKKEPDVFDRERLRQYAGRLPAGFALAPIDARLYEQTGRERWSRDFCSQFSGWEDYRTRGLGFVALWNGTPVSGASSYTVYHGGIEIEIDTRRDFRRRGLATACAARLILACLERGLYPSWDAANPGSLALAEKLGYHADKPYTAYMLEEIDPKE